MSVTIRILPAIEYIRLKDIEEGFIPNPDGSVVVVAEDEDGEICGRIMLVPFLHLDGIWLREDKRKGRVMIKMEKALVELMEDNDISGVQVDVYVTKMEEYLSRWGYEKSKIISVFRKEFSNGNGRS